MSDKKHWIVKIVPALAFAAGIIMASIGGIMTLSSGAKLALFDAHPYNQISREQCEFDYSFHGIPVMDKKTVDTTPKKRTEEEITRCIERRKIEEKQRFQQEKKQNLIDGLSTLIVGLLLIIFFRKKE